MTTQTLCDCGHIAIASGCTTGYGTDSAGKTHCFACCADRDKEQMTRDGRTTLYLVKTATGQHEVTNWPASLKFRVIHQTTGRHNIARTRHDVYFIFDGKYWHGVQYGENSQLCHCRRLKEMPSHV